MINVPVSVIFHRIMYNALPVLSHSPVNSTASSVAFVSTSQHARWPVSTNQHTRRRPVWTNQHTRGRLWTNQHTRRRPAWTNQHTRRRPVWTNQHTRRRSSTRRSHSITCRQCTILSSVS